MTLELGILISGLLLLIATLSSRLADQFGLPTLVLFLLVGMLSGSEGLGGIAFDDAQMAQTIGTIALMIILFSGGLDTEWRTVRPVLAPGLVLSTLGVILTTLLLGTFAKYMLGTYTSFNIGGVGLTWSEAMLLAAIVSSTDAAAVFSIYRTSRIQPRRQLRSLLEFESGSNDPMAVLLTVTILGIISNGNTISFPIIFTLVRQLGLGIVVGLVIGWLASSLINRQHFSTSDLSSMLVLAVGMIIFGTAYWLGGNGFLAIYIGGLFLGNRVRRNHAEILQFHNSLSWLMQIIIFVMLGLLVFPSQLWPVAGVSIVLALFLIFVGRPLAVLLCYLPFKPKAGELAYVSWVGLRGSVPIVLATFPATYGIAHAGQIFHIVFFIVLSSVLIQGLTLVSAAKFLKITEANS